MRNALRGTNACLAGIATESCGHGLRRKRASKGTEDALRVRAKRRAHAHLRADPRPHERSRACARRSVRSERARYRPITQAGQALPKSAEK